MTTPPGVPAPLDFYARLRWLDGRPLLDMIEDYRREFLTRALYTFRPDGVPLYNMVLAGRAKKNWKSTDLVLAALYRMLCWDSVQLNDCLIAANTEDQANDDLELTRRLVLANPDTLKREIVMYHKELRRKDGRGIMRILPSRDAVGLHGKTALFLGFDEIHGYRSWDIFEALAPDPTRSDTLTWITTYDTIYNSPGVPLYDLKKTALSGEDPRLCFQWYSADTCTDAAFAELPSEERANPSMGSWPEGSAYLEQQRRRLPSHKFRRLHLNLPGTPSGAFFDGDALTACIMTGLKRIPPDASRRYFGYVDMSGGSADDAVLAIGHFDCGRRVLDAIAGQDGKPPFNPRLAVRKFARILKDYGIDQVTGDRYAGETHRFSFTEEGIRYWPSSISATDLYEQTEPLVNASEVEFLDHPKLQEQLLTLVVRGAKVTHQPGDHDDYANAACGCLALMPKNFRKSERGYREPPRVLHAPPMWGRGPMVLHER